MKRLAVGLALLLLASMGLLNPLGRKSLLAYYAGILAVGR